MDKQTQRTPVFSVYFQQYSSYEFGIHRVDTIHLSQLQGFSQDGYYKSTGKIPIP